MCVLRLRPGWWVLVVLLGVGCAHRLPSTATQVRRIQFDGNMGLFTDRSDANLRGAIGHPKPSRIWPFRRTVSLDLPLLEQDRLRLYSYLAHRGYFDAKVVRWEIRELRPARARRPPVVAVIGHLALGEPSTVTDVQMTGLRGLARVTQSRARAQVTGQQGHVFRLDTHQAGVASSREVLLNRGYAHAQVNGSVSVDRAARSVVLTYEASPGPVSQFGEIRLAGLERVPEGPVRGRLAFSEGDRYRLRDLRETQQRLYGMGTFSLVSVFPVLRDDPPNGVVDVEITVEERPPRSLSFRGGLALQSGRQEALLGARFEHLNVLRRLIGAQLDVSGGYALLAATLPELAQLGTVRGGPVLDARFDLRFPYLPVSAWTAQLRAQFEHGVYEAYQTNQPSVSPSVSGTLAPGLTLALAYRLQLNQYVDLQVDPVELSRLDIAPDLRNGRFFDTYLEQTLVWDTRNDPLAPVRGHRVGLTLREAGTWLGGDFDYLGVRADLRGYLNLKQVLRLPTPRLVGAARLGGGYLLPYGAGDRAAVPSAERLYLGGSGTVRGWAYQHLGPYVCDVDGAVACTSTPGVDPGAGVDTVPVGGLVAAWGSVELRQSVGSYGVAAFVDAGMVWATPADVPRIPVLPSVGLGARAVTPVGPLRLDVAVRTDNLPMFRQEPRFFVHLGLGEAF